MQRTSNNIDRFVRFEPFIVGNFFPKGWESFFDEQVPLLVKQLYSQKEQWKNKSFSEKDIRFFSRGIIELSNLFSVEDIRKMPGYLSHPRFRSAYLLYFLPLQAAKFLMLFELHHNAMKAAIKHGHESGTLRLIDIGAGPGTASIAFLFWLAGLNCKCCKSLQRIELVWIDTSRAIMQDGIALVELFKKNHPEIKFEISVSTHTVHAEKARSLIGKNNSLVILGHVLNEGRHSREFLSEIHDSCHGGGTLIVEPASKSNSQYLSKLRNETLPKPLWGPCLHAAICPLTMGRDWCHFSIPAKIPGKNFSSLSRMLGSERNWLKFSYIWLAARGTSTRDNALPDRASYRRVVSDPIKSHNGLHILLCEPDRVKHMPIQRNTNAARGSIAIKRG